MAHVFGSSILLGLMAKLCDKTGSEKLPMFLESTYLMGLLEKVPTRLEIKNSRRRILNLKYVYLRLYAI